MIYWRIDVKTLKTSAHYAIKDETLMLKYASVNIQLCFESNTATTESAIYETLLMANPGLISGL